MFAFLDAVDNVNKTNRDPDQLDLVLATYCYIYCKLFQDGEA